MDNPEKVATVGKQETGEDKQKHNVTQKTKKMSNTDPNPSKTRILNCYSKKYIIWFEFKKLCRATDDERPILTRSCCKIDVYEVGDFLHIRGNH